jgi:hypothetical protein
MSTQLVTPATLELLQVDLTQVPPEITCDGSDLDWSHAVVIEAAVSPKRKICRGRQCPVLARAAAAGQPHSLFRKKCSLALWLLFLH